MGRKIRKRLERFAEHRSLVRIRRAIPKTHSTSGWVLAVGAELVLLAVEEDFVFDGFVVLCICDIEDVRRTKVDELHQRWMLDGGLDIADIPLPPVDLTDIPELLTSIEPSNLVLVVEAEHPDHAQFELGCIESVGRKATRMRYLSTKAKWIPELRKIRHKHVTWVSFESRYTRMYAQHAPPYEA